MLTYIECLSCRELWQESAILDACDGNEEIAIECIERELCPDCHAAAEAAWQEAARRDAWGDDVDVALVLSSHPF